LKHEAEEDQGVPQNQTEKSATRANKCSEALNSR